MEHPDGTSSMDSEPDDEPPGLDVHASAALDRLTRWAAKAVRAAAAVITLVDDGHTVLASATTVGPASDSQRLREFGAQLARTGQPQAIGDARAERWLQSGDDEGIAFLGAPLLDRDGVAAGSFCVMDIRPRNWTIQDVELVGELASSAMTELDLLAARADAEREKAWSNHQQDVLELIAARAPLSRTLGGLLGATETQSPGMLAAITRLERTRGGPDRLRVVAALGLPRGFTSALDGIAVGEGASIGATAAFRRAPAVVPDIARGGLTPWYADLAAAHGLRAGWATPILARDGAVLGTLTIHYRTLRTPSAREEVVIGRAVHLARLAIEQADGAAALRRNAARAQTLAREQTALQRVATHVAGETDPELVFGLVAEQAGRLLKAEAGYVLRFQDDQCYRNMGSWARDEERLLPRGAVVEHLPDGVCAALRKGRTARRCSVEPARDSLGYRHRIAAPVLVEDRSWGMVVALRDTTEFRREDEKRLVRFAQLASVAVANANAHDALATQARTDPLTGLANRRAFDERLAEEADRANRHTRALSVMLVDVDNFKSINDRFGHATGDRVLVNLAESLRSVMRGGDLLARIGGDEMALILPDCRSDQAVLVAERMLAAVSSESALSRRHQVTLSAGVASLAAGQSADDLLRCADQALYAAKDRGRNRVVSHEAAMSDRTGLRLSA